MILKIVVPTHLHAHAHSLNLQYPALQLLWDHLESISLLYFIYSRHFNFLVCLFQNWTFCHTLGDLAYLQMFSNIYICKILASIVSHLDLYSFILFIDIHLHFPTKVAYRKHSISLVSWFHLRFSIR